MLQYLELAKNIDEKMWDYGGCDLPGLTLHSWVQQG